MRGLLPPALHGDGRAPTERSNRQHVGASTGSHFHVELVVKELSQRFLNVPEQQTLHPKQ